jgi:hypothetical protein
MLLYTIEVLAKLMAVLIDPEVMQLLVTETSSANEI